MLSSSEENVSPNETIENLTTETLDTTLNNDMLSSIEENVSPNETIENLTTETLDTTLNNDMLSSSEENVSPNETIENLTTETLETTLNNQMHPSSEFDNHFSRYSLIRKNEKISSPPNELLIRKYSVSKLHCFKKCFNHRCHFIVFNEESKFCEVFPFFNNVSFVSNHFGYKVYHFKN